MREADITIDIKRRNQNSDELIYNTGFTNESPLMDVSDLTGISGGLAISFEYNFKNQYYGSGIDTDEYTNYNVVQVDLYTGDSYGFTPSSGNLYQAFSGENIEALQGVVGFQYTEPVGTPPSFFKMLPYDTIGPGVIADANKIIAEKNGQDPDTPIKLVNDDQITVVNLDGMRAVNQNFIEVKFPFGHSVEPIVTFGIEYNGASPPASYLGAMVVGKPTKERVSFLLTDVPPSNGYSLYVRSASGATQARQFNFTPWEPAMTNLKAWYDASDASTITESSSVVSQVDDKSGNGFHLNVLTANKVGPKTGVRTLNNLNVLTWDVPNQVLENISFSHNQASIPLCIAVVFKADLDGNQDFIFAGTTSSSVGDKMALRRYNVSNGFQILGGSGTGTNIGMGSGANTVLEGETYMVLSKLNSSNSQIRIDGRLKNTGNIGTNNLNAIKLGANAIGGSNLKGYIAELVFFEDSSVQEKMEGYLAHKWGTTNRLPSSHPYKTVVPQV